jgi:hypothetical protein
LDILYIDHTYPDQTQLSWVNTIRRPERVVWTSSTSLPRSRDIELVQPCKLTWHLASPGLLPSHI